MNKRHAMVAVAMAGALALSACTGPAGGEGTEGSGQPGAASEAAPQAPQSQAQAEQPPATDSAAQQAEQRYIDELVQQTIAEFAHPGMSEYEKVKAAFDYMIENTTLIDPVGLDLWRIREDSAEPPSYVENRSLSVLLFHLGKCEDYAAALTLLLQGMGLEAYYVPGLTYSTQGALVDHAWTVVQVDGVWYHVDCQLEQNISKQGSIRYKYFMRSDATMAGSHRWGQNLIDARLLRAEQNEEIARAYIPPACPTDYPTPERYAFTLPQAPDVEALQAEIEAEFRAYEELYGPLEALELNVIPPVFAQEGYGPSD